MLNKVLIVWSVALTAGLGYVLYSSNASTEEVEKNPSTVQEDSSSKQHESRLAFIYADSINLKYDFVSKSTEQLEKDEKRMQYRLEQKIKALEARFGELQTKAPAMTQSQLQEAQIELQEKEQEIGELRLKLAEELELKRIKFQEDFFLKVKAYLEAHNADKKYDAIFSYQLGGQLLLANDAIDITQEVIEGLNQEYANETAKKGE